MACCGRGNQANVEYEVTLGDGSVQTVATMAAARILQGQDTSVNPATGLRRAAVIKAVPKKKA